MLLLIVFELFPVEVKVVVLNNIVPVEVLLPEIVQYFRVLLFASLMNSTVEPVVFVFSIVNCDTPPDPPG